MNLPEAFRGNLETRQINLEKKKERHDLMQFFGIETPPVGLKWKYLKASKELVCEMDLYKEGWKLVPRAVIGINGEEGAGKTQLLYDLSVLYGIPFENVKTGGQTLRLAGEKLRKKGFFKKKEKTSLTDQATFVERADEDDKALDDMQFGWTESPSEQPKAIDSRLIGFAIYYVKDHKPDARLVSFYITASENARMKRLSERAEKSVEVVKAETEERRRLDIERYTRLYKGTKRFELFGEIINPHNTMYYDFIIDNTHYDRAVALQTMHDHLLEMKLVQKREKPKVYDREKEVNPGLAENGDIFPSTKPN